MNKPCKKCRSWAINEHMHGRTVGVDSDLCDVCYWRSRSVRLQAARDIVDEQAEDEGIWAPAVYITEAHLQAELRRLHAAIEGDA